MSNFSYWEDKPEFESFIIPAKKAEAFLVTAPEMCMSECRKVAEQMVRLYLKNKKISLTYKKDGKIHEAKMLGGEILNHFGNYLKNINGINIKAELEDINNKTKVFHHSNNYACIEDGVAVLKKLFFCLTVLFPIKSISADNFSEAEIQNFPKHLLRSINIQKFLSLEMLKYIALGDITHTDEYIAQHHNDLFSEINGEFPLLVAIQQDEIGIVKLFDKYFKDQYALFAYNLGKRGLDPMHPIFYAAKYNSRKCFDYYFENLIPSEGINMTTQNSKRSLLMYACIGNAEEILSKLLIIPEIEINKKDLYDSTALLYLLQTNPNSPFIKILVERGADLNVESQDRFPLMYATENNLQLFLDNGAELNKKNGVSCLYYAINFAPGSVNHIIKILKKAAPEISWNSNAFAYACRWGKDIDFIEILWNKIKEQPKDCIEFDLRFAFKLSLWKDNNIEVLLWLLKKGFYSLSEKDSFSMHPAIFTLLLSKKTRDELFLQLQRGEISCKKPKEKRTIIESLLYYNQLETLYKILASNVKIPINDSLLLLEYLVALEKDGKDCKEISDYIKTAVHNGCIDYNSVLIYLIKNHPVTDFDIASEFLNNGYNFSKYAYEILRLPFTIDWFVTGIPFSNEEDQKLYFQNADIRKKTNTEFLKLYNEQSFQDVNLRLIKNAISFGANPNIKDDDQKSALDYAKINGIDESIFIVENKHDIYDFSVDMPPSQKGAIRGHIVVNGEKVKGSIAKQLIPEGTDASDYSNQKLKVILISELQTKQAGDPYYKLDFAP